MNRISHICSFKRKRKRFNKTYLGRKRKNEAELFYRLKNICEAKTNNDVRKKTKCVL
jgi:hypothetical protein